MIVYTLCASEDVVIKQESIRDGVCVVMYNHQ